MADFFLQLAANKRARQVVNTLGLPVPMPQTLDRLQEPWSATPLAGRSAVVGPPGDLGDLVSTTITEAGATVQDSPDVRPAALVIDATAMGTPGDLRGLHDFFHPRLKRLASCGRVVVLARPPLDTDSVAVAATRRALEGFVRATGREIGRRGSTANLVEVAPGTESRLPAVLRFLLSPRAAFITGQPLRISDVCAETGAPAVQPLEGKVALVTGAARGIGAAIARAMAREGAHVVVLDRPEDDELGGQVAGEVGGSFLALDVTAASAPDRIRAHLEAQHEGVDIVVHNAGITRDKTLAKMPPELWDLTIAVNLTAILSITDAILPVVKDGGRVLALSSIAGIAGNVGQTNYSATKAGVIGFVQALAPTVAARGVSVNAIAPGFIESRMTDAIPLATREVARRLANLGQGGLPEDIAEAATFLASPGASGLTGQVLRVCGGNFVGA